MARDGRPKTRTAPWDVAEPSGGFAWPAGLTAAATRWRQVLADWAIAETAPGRLLPWLPVAFGAGIALYFTADREPVWWAPCALAAITLAVAYAARRRPAGFPLALGLSAMACGFCVATLQTARVAHPVLQISTWSAQVAGFVETREEREKSDRIVVRVHRFDAPRVGEKPERVRVSVRKGTASDVGSYVAFKAHLSPPLTPVRPGGYDFARDMYFQQIGASGYVLGKIKTSQPPAIPGLWLRYAAAIDAMREGINRRIHSVLPGDRGSIASALVTGKRNAISAPVNDAFYVSSLAHVLAISGYHMAVVAGLVFFFVRAGLALLPGLALRRPIKKWAALAAFGTAAFYLVMSGASVSTQRSFIMIAIVLIGVMLDRAAITFRTISVAAFAVLLIAPQALLHPSFQMSFAATLALIAGYQHGLPGLFGRSDADTSLGARAALWGGREIVGLVLASVIAGLATEPYAAFHFHRVAPYGVIANLLAMPVVSVMVMPMGIVAVLTMPFGLDAIFWQLMGAGIDWMIAVVLWVTSLPGSVWHMPAFGTGPLLVSTMGLLLICLLRSPLRWSGAVIAVGATLWALNAPRPDILLAGDGQLAAVRAANGKLALLSSGRDNFAIKEWLLADGDGRAANDLSLKDGVRCDPVGCTASLAGGKLVAFALAPEAFEEDCARAVVVLSPRQSPFGSQSEAFPGEVGTGSPSGNAIKQKLRGVHRFRETVNAFKGTGGCTALLIDRAAWRIHGATALYRNGDGFTQSFARPPGVDRPWARDLSAAAPADVTTSKARRAATPDATPKVEDVDEGD